MTTDQTRRIVQAYFAAWTTRHTDEAYALLAPDLAFWGPTASYDSAAAFRPALIAFAAMTTKAEMTALVVEGERAAMAYDCSLSPLATPLKIASFFLVRDGRISQYQTMFDATELRKLQAPRVPGNGQTPIR